MDKIKLIIAGSRDFYDYELLERELSIKQSFPNWDTLGKQAGYISSLESSLERNEKMAKCSNYCICFWNGSKGTKHMIDLASRYKLGVNL